MFAKEPGCCTSSQNPSLPVSDQFRQFSPSLASLCTCFYQESGTRPAAASTQSAPRGSAADPSRDQLWACRQHSQGPAGRNHHYLHFADEEAQPRRREVTSTVTNQVPRHRGRGRPGSAQSNSHPVLSGGKGSCLITNTALRQP